MPFHELRSVIAEAEFRELIDLAELATMSRRGHRGGAALARAIEHHLPQLAQTRSPLEERFVALCEAHGIQMPDVNTRIEGMTVDCLWRDEHVVVELDGRAAHVSDSRVERDRARDLRLRAAGYTVRRYTWQQITREPEAVIQDLHRALRG